MFFIPPKRDRKLLERGSFHSRTGQADLIVLNFLSLRRHEYTLGFTGIDTTAYRRENCLEAMRTKLYTIVELKKVYSEKKTSKFNRAYTRARTKTTTSDGHLRSLSSEGLEKLSSVKSFVFPPYSKKSGEPVYRGKNRGFHHVLLIVKKNVLDARFTGQRPNAVFFLVFLLIFFFFLVSFSFAYILALADAAGIEENLREYYYILHENTRTHRPTHDARMRQFFF